MKQACENQKAEIGRRKRESADCQELVTRRELARRLRVSLRTLDRMLADGEIPPVRLHGWSVRFYVPEVIEALRDRNRKWGRNAFLSANPESEIGDPTPGGGPPIRIPKSEPAYPRRAE